MDRRYFVTFSILLSIFTFTFSKEPDIYILSSYFLGLAFSTLYGEKKLNFLFILLILPFVIYNYLPSYYLFVIAISSISLFYYNELSYVFIPLGLDLVMLNISYYIDIFIFLGIIIAYKLLKYDMRGIIASGIILLVLTAFISNMRIPLSNIAYFDLVFGVIGSLVESSTMKIPNKVKVPLTLLLFPLLTFLFPLPNTYYWWNPNSFLFKNFLSLYIIGYGYNLKVDEWWVYFFSNFLISKLGQYLGLHILIFFIYFLSGLSAYFFFSNNKLLFSFIYSVLTPIQEPQLAITYSLFPLALAITTKLDVKRYLAFSAISFLSTFIFPFAFTISSLLLNRRKEYIIFSYFLSLFWFIPYLILGFPKVVLNVNPLELYILITIISILSFVVDNKRFIFLSLIFGLTYVALQLPFSFVLYPLIILFTLLISTEKKYLIPIVLIILITFQGITLSNSLTFYGLPKGVENAINNLEKQSFGLVYWEGNYSLASPYPITNSTGLAKYIVTSSYNVTQNPLFISQPYPVVIRANITELHPPQVLSISNSEIKLENNTIYWIMPKPLVTSEIEIVFPYPMKMEGKLYFNINTTNFDYFYVIIQYTSGYKEFEKITTIPVNGSIEYIMIYYYPLDYTIIKLVPYYNESGKLIPLVEYITPYTYNETNINGVIEVYLNANINVNISSIKGYVFSVNGSKFSDYKVLYPGKYIIIVKQQSFTFYNYGIYGSIISFSIFLAYIILRNRLTKLYEKAKSWLLHFFSNSMSQK